MAISALSLPIEIPWKLIAASPDMMDVTFCDTSFPFDWRSSLAISVYEPKPDDLPDQFCEGRLTYVKVTATITGYQPTQDETDQAPVIYPDVPTEDLNNIIGQYFACYGVLLNVAVFPLPLSEDLSKYPHILDIEPKTRDLYQAATETGEVLTASNSSIKTGKTLTHTDSSETGLEVNATYKSPQTPYGSVEQGQKLTQKWGETDQDQRVTQADASRESRETQGTTTNLSQMYNLLTGYHAGTNRVVFLMLPRPHILQPTDHRTFVKGLRIIEGIQEFFLVVARPSDIEGLCIEAVLETGHFPENAPVDQPPAQYDTSSETFGVTQYAGAGDVLHPAGHVAQIDYTYPVLSGWVVDRSQGDLPNHPGVSEIANSSNTQANNSLKDYMYGVATDSTVSVSGTIQGGAIFSSGATFDRTYKVFTRSQNPKTGGDAGPVVTTPALITSRGLCVRFTSGECPEVLPPKELGPPHGQWIVDEPQIRIDPSALRTDVIQTMKSPAMKELIRGIHYGMATSWRMPTRHAPGEVGFLDSDYFKAQILKLLPPSALNQPLSEVPVLDKRIADSFGVGLKVADALNLGLRAFVKKTGLSVSEATAARRKLLGAKTP